jgi:hypothetical protein
MGITTLTAIVLAFNEAAHITECLKSLRFADRRLVVDSGSQDYTVSLARAEGAEVVHHAFENYAAQRNFALSLVPDGWVLFVDADERVSAALAEEIRRTITDGGCAGYRIPRDNFIFGRLTRGAGWFPDYQTRLLRVGLAHYDASRHVHEVVVLSGCEGTLEHPFVHYNYHDLAQFRDKQRRYTAYDARILFEQGVTPKPRNYVLQPLRHFWWRFVTLRGYGDGLHGLRLSALMAWYELRKYVLLRQMWRDAAHSA